MATGTGGIAPRAQSDFPHVHHPRYSRGYYAFIIGASLTVVGIIVGLYFFALVLYGEPSQRVVIYALTPLPVITALLTYRPRYELRDDRVDTFRGPGEWGRAQMQLELVEEIRETRFHPGRYVGPQEHMFCAVRFGPALEVIMPPYQHLWLTPSDPAWAEDLLRRWRLARQRRAERLEAAAEPPEVT